MACNLRRSAADPQPVNIYYARTAEDMIAHLHAHRDAGSLVEDETIGKLHRDSALYQALAAGWIRVPPTSSANHRLDVRYRELVREVGKTVCGRPILPRWALAIAHADIEDYTRVAKRIAKSPETVAAIETILKMDRVDLGVRVVRQFAEDQGLLP